MKLVHLSRALGVRPKPAESPKQVDISQRVVAANQVYNYALQHKTIYIDAIPHAVCYNLSSTIEAYFRKRLR
jgi:hypothetical protein